MLLGTIPINYQPISSIAEVKSHIFIFFLIYFKLGQKIQNLLVIDFVSITHLNASYAMSMRILSTLKIMSSFKK